MSKNIKKYHDGWDKLLNNNLSEEERKKTLKEMTKAQDDFFEEVLEAFPGLLDDIDEDE